MNRWSETNFFFGQSTSEANFFHPGATNGPGADVVGLIMDNKHFRVGKTIVFARVTTSILLKMAKEFAPTTSKSLGGGFYTHVNPPP